MNFGVLEGQDLDFFCIICIIVLLIFDCHIMKRIVIFLPILPIMVLLGCSSNVDKANKLIKDYMFKNLQDFKSYEVVETKVDAIYQSPATDDECLRLASSAKSHKDQRRIYDNKAERDKETMSIWLDGYGTYAREQYNKAYDSWLQNNIESFTHEIAYLRDSKLLLERVATLDNKEQYGWMATHTYRSKNAMGGTVLGATIFYISKDFKQILKAYSPEDDELTPALETIKNIINYPGTTEEADSLIVRWESVIDKYNQNLRKLRKE